MFVELWYQWDALRAREEARQSALDADIGQAYLQRRQRAPDVWVAYHSDRSGFYVAASEVEALRWAVTRYMSVKAVTLPSDLSELGR